MHIALREWDFDAVLVQSVVYYLFGTVDITYAFGHQYLLLHCNGDGAVVHLLQGDADAAFRVHNVAPESIFALQGLQCLAQQFAHLLDVGAIGHAHRNLDELITMVTREVAEVLGEQCRVEERHLGAIDGLNLCALVTYVRDLATNAIAHNPVADAQAARHELDP